MSALEGGRIAVARRRGKHLIVEIDGGAGGESPTRLALLIHLMSAGRLQLYDKPAGPRDRTSRLLVGLEDGRELRLREFGSKQAAWVKLLPSMSWSRTMRSRRSAPKHGRIRVQRRSCKSCWTRRDRCTRCCATST